MFTRRKLFSFCGLGVLAALNPFRSRPAVASPDIGSCKSWGMEGAAMEAWPILDIRLVGDEYGFELQTRTMPMFVDGGKIRKGEWSEWSAVTAIHQESSLGTLLAQSEGTETDVV